MTTLAGIYTIDPAHTTIGFVARHAMVTKTRGHFGEHTGTISVGESIADSSANVVVQAASIDTGNSDRDAHVRGEDFFDVERFPEITFATTAFDVDQDGNGTVTGDLTIKGITKPVTLKVDAEGLAEDHAGNTRFGFEATGKINRTDFGIDFNAPLNTGGVLISEEIKLEIEVSAIKQ
ncbi:polyisoprenoid-binding protein [Corynebacterium lizhenjunii]|uniref:Polyisoprenoid-binding protein n=1 Tax=Corynebacterium lizhenjunii TaxID=2709394 RepID=A0A7T0KF37_9CORY|nr:YceI family protein [Corynebacterium lizhenjunii]QPK79150.1 polyisoprenoid-binding protein [Corynebacterium lizhenjunii]